MLSPFRALRPDPSVAGDLAGLTSPPYDVLDDGAVADLEAVSDWNVVRLILPRDEPDAGRDRYAAAAVRLAAWREAGVLRPDPEPALYVYEQADPAGGHAQRGLLGALHLSPPEDGIVLPHESTMAGPVADRLALYDAVGADLEPIFLVYDGGGAAADAVAAADTGTPLVDADLPDGLRHRLWALTDRDALEAVAADLLPRTALIADGHHRYATYLRRQADHHAAGHGRGPWDAGLCLLVDATSFGPQVHPIHRVVPGVPAAVLARRTAAAAAVAPVAGGVTEALRALGLARRAGPAFVLADRDSVHLVSQLDADRLDAALPADRSPAWRALDVTVLHRFLVPELWGLPDDEETVGFEHDVEAALRRADATSGTAVLLGPTPVESVAAVAAAGERMPRKSTLFTPKPRSGLVLRDHRDA
ncbi:MAG TPA: DUF1015 domain-containing protein [Mycobacteriales bacterium]|nr:DUF1015 domain-containing protein [Mycobacteriales bacterium]